jgi:2-(3-amino-3-carboxypropyl)histidine synthase
MEKFERFDFQLGYVEKELKRRKAKKALLQFAEGIKIDSAEVVKELEGKIDTKIVVSGQSCWGGCDLALNEAKDLECDIIVHFGHAPFIKVDFPVLYVYVKDNKDLSKLLKASLKELKKHKIIGLVGSIQHSHQMDKIKEFYEINKKKVEIPKAVGFSYMPGHVVGCEYRGLKDLSKNIDAVVVIGNRFHGLGAALSVLDKPVYLIDAYNDEISDMSKFRDKILKQRAISIDRIKDAKNIGILVGMKPGQKFGSYETIKKEFEKQGKQVTIITMNEFTPDKIMNFYKVEGFVELACPRIATDDYGRYPKPIITFREALVVLGKLSWEELLEQGLL